MPQFTLGTGLIGHTVPAVAIGVAQRALDELVALARYKQRGYAVRATINDRPAFQAFVARAQHQLQADRQLMMENGRRVSAEAMAGRPTAQRAGPSMSSTAQPLLNSAIRQWRLLQRSHLNWSSGSGMSSLRQRQRCQDLKSALSGMRGE